MDRLANGWRRALGMAVAVATLLTVSAAAAATTLTVWCWDTNFNGADHAGGRARIQGHPSRRDTSTSIDSDTRTTSARSCRPSCSPAPPRACPTSC